MRFLLAAAFAGLLLLAACKKDKSVITPVPLPAIKAIDRSRAQSGDTLTITGTNLQLGSLQPQVLIGGREADLLSAAPEKIVVIVPTLVKSSPVILLLGNASAEGPELTIIPTPAITSYEPRFVVLGDTLLIHGEHFAALPADNQVYVGGIPALVATVSDTEMKIVVPAAASTGLLSLRVYNGPLFQYKGTPVLLRQVHYDASDILDYIRQDPAFSFVYGYIAANEAGLAGQPGRDTLMAYLKGERKGSVFLPNNYFGYNAGRNSVESVVNFYRWYDVFWGLLAVGYMDPVGYEGLQTGVRYESLLSGEMMGWSPGTRDYFSITEESGGKFLHPLGASGDPIGTLKILRAVNVGGSILYEIDGLPSFESQP